MMTIHEVSKLAGVSVRTLHYYDAIGLLPPTALTESGYHLFKQLRQQQAQACWAINTGCPRIGVCLPSFGMIAGASRIRMKSTA